MSEELIQFWGQCKLAAPPFAHPADLSILRADVRWLNADDPVDFDAYVRSPRFGDAEDNRLHFSLLPVPYSGDLINAEIVILMLNPGFEYSDYWAEAKSPEFRKRLEQNLRQSFTGVEFPFLYLDPQFCWHSGFMWWEKKLRDVIQVIAKGKYRGNFREGLRDLSTKLVCVELVPYHSVSFNDHKLIDRLPSVHQAREFVRTSLVPAAKARNKTLIVTRQVRGWRLVSGMENVVIYEGGHTRGASLSSNSAGGKAILARYGIS